jgi:hypothetical protein
MSSYEKRSKDWKEPHCLAEIKPRGYFGVYESMMGLSAGQLPCTQLNAGEDSTTLLYIEKSVLVSSFRAEQIKNLLDAIQQKPLVEHVSDE